jgi:catechol 2,3-dioxygenase-like lactoylglutathione lyase family enzyme
MSEFRFKGAFPIGDTDVAALPVKEIGPAVAFYIRVLGFTLIEKTAKTAKLKRDDAEIGLAVNGADPEQASVYFEVENLDGLRNELIDAGSNPTDFRIDQHGGSKYRVFFDKEPYGVCFCFGSKME